MNRTTGWNFGMTMGIVGGVLLMVAANGCAQKSETATPKAPAAKSAAVSPQAKAPAQPAVPSDPKALLVAVDDTKLTQGEADQRIERYLASSGNRVPPEQIAAVMPRLRQQVAEQFVMQTLLENEAARQKTEVGDAEITNAVAMIKGRLPDGMTLEDMLRKEGVDETTFRSNLVSELRIKTLVETQFKDTKPKDEDIAAFYEKEKERFAKPESVHARHILVKVDAKADEKVKAEKKQKADDLKKQLDAGANFAELAKASDDVQSGARGGDLGTFGKGDMVPPFEAAAFSQATNAIGPVVETEFGYHIIQVLSHDQARTVPLDEVKAQIAQHLEQVKQQEAFAAYVKMLKAKAKIVYGSQGQPAPEAVPES